MSNTDTKKSEIIASKPLADEQATQGTTQNNSIEHKKENSNISDAKLKHERQKINLEKGFLGGIWGVSSSVPNNIAALTITVLLLFGIIYTVIGCFKILSIKDLWTIITPMITLAFGYLFGEKHKN